MSDKPEPEVQHLHSNQEMADLLQDMIDRVKRGENIQATLRVVHRDGTVQVLEIGYETEEERDAAMAKLLKVLGGLH